MFFVILEVLAVGGLLVGYIAKSELLEHNRMMIQTLKTLLANEASFDKPKIQEMVLKALDQTV